jgi:hypothetical protein
MTPDIALVLYKGTARSVIQNWVADSTSVIYGSRGLLSEGEEYFGPVDNQYKEGQGKHMKRLSIVGLCLVAVCAFSAVTVAGASAALPEFVPKAGKNFPILFDLSSGKGKLVPKSTLLPIIECATDLGEGTIIGTMLVRINMLTFHGCIVQGTTHTCTTPGSPTGLILAAKLLGDLGYIKKNGEGGKETGVIFKPETGTLLFEFKCEGIEANIEIGGEIVGLVTSNLNKQEVIVEIKFVILGRGIQAKETIELLSSLPEPLFMKEVHLTAFGGQAALENEETYKLQPAGETVEIKA